MTRIPATAIPGPMIASPARYSVLCVLVLGGLGWLAHEGPRLGLASALLLLPVAAWPAWLALAHPAAVRKAQAMSVLTQGVRPWWSPFLGGALVRQVLAVPVALLAAWSVGWTLIAGGWTAWAWLLGTAALLYSVARLVARQARPLRPYARLRPVLLVAPAATAALLTAAWALTAGSQAMDNSTLAQRVAAEPRYEGASALLAWAVDGTAVVNGVRLWGLAWAEGEVQPLATLWQGVAAFGQSWLLASVFAGLLLPPREARRILNPSDADIPPPPASGRVAAAGVLAGLLCSAFVAALAQAEAWATSVRRPVAWAEAPVLISPGQGMASPRIAPSEDPTMGILAPLLPTPSTLRAVVEAERIGALTCPPGFIARVRAIDRQLQVIADARRQEVEAAARAGFDAIRAKVPVFLDGYYSLTAEYVRTFHLVAGDAEVFLERELAEALEVEASFEAFRAAISTLATPLPPELVLTRDRIVADCGLLPTDSAILEVTASGSAEMLNVPPDVETIGLRTRLAASGAGLMAGGVAGAIMAKLVAKEAFGLAAEAVAKLTLAKAAGGLGGAAAGAGAGALAGSVVPGIGTTVGAAVGGVLGGLALGVATDYAMIRIEEAVSREAFEAEIRLSITEAEREFLAQIQ